MSNKPLQWKPSRNKKILGIKAIQHITPMNTGSPIIHEECIAGEGAEIYEHSEGLYGVAIFDSRLANKLAELLGDKRRFKFGDEALFKVEKTTGINLVSVLRIKKHQALQCELASNR